MAKPYTAQEMRALADKLESRSIIAVCRYDGEHDEWLPLWQNPDATILALRQAADALEREAKAEKKYEYAVKYIGGYISDKARFETLDAAKMCRNNLAYDIVRRPVGEWEEVKV